MIVYDVRPVGYAAGENILGSIPQSQTFRDAPDIHLSMIAEQSVAYRLAALGDIFDAIELRLGRDAPRKNILLAVDVRADVLAADILDSPTINKRVVDNAAVGDIFDAVDFCVL